MPKRKSNTTGIIIIILIVLGVFYYSQQEEDSIITVPQFQLESSIAVSSTFGSSACEDYRDSRDDDCVGNCVLITTKIFEGEQWSGSMGDIDADEIGEYGFLYDSDDSCGGIEQGTDCLLYTSPSPRDRS